jgi:hypothetical protein
VIGAISADPIALADTGLPFVEMLVGSSLRWGGDLGELEWLSDSKRLVPPCAVVFGNNDDELKRTAINLMVLLLERVWLLDPKEDHRNVLDDLGPPVMNMIMGSNGALTEAGLHFFVLFLDHDVYRDDDAPNFACLMQMRPFLSRESYQFRARLLRYWDVRTAAITWAY